MSYLQPQLGTSEVESEGRIERFIHLFASAVTIGELIVHRRTVARSPIVVGAALLSLAIMWRKA